MPNLYVEDGYHEPRYAQVGITINWGAREIFVPRSELTLVQSAPTFIYELDLNAFRLALKDLEDSDEGMPYPTTHSHNTTVTVGGVTLARVIEIINGYTVTFEDGQYAVTLTGANSNVGDRANVNQVSVRSANSAGLIGVTGLTANQVLQLAEIYRRLGLEAGTPVVVTPTTLVAGDIAQTISEAGTTRTVERA